MTTTEIVCMSLMPVFVLCFAIVDWVYAREIKKDLERDLDYLRRIRDAHRRGHQAEVKQ